MHELVGKRGRSIRKDAIEQEVGGLFGDCSIDRVVFLQQEIQTVSKDSRERNRTALNDKMKFTYKSMLFPEVCSEQGDRSRENVFRN